MTGAGPPAPPALAGRPRAGPAGSTALHQRGGGGAGAAAKVEYHSGRTPLGDESHLTRGFMFRYFSNFRKQIVMPGWLQVAYKSRLPKKKKKNGRRKICIQISTTKISILTDNPPTSDDDPLTTKSPTCDTPVSRPVVPAREVRAGPFPRPLLASPRFGPGASRGRHAGAPGTPSSAAEREGATPE